MTTLVQPSLEMPNWKGAACRGRTDLDGDFFPDDLLATCPPSNKVKELCELHCPIRAQCLNWALAHDVEGVWGGMTKYQRDQVRRTASRGSLKVRRARCPGCYSTTTIANYRGQVCVSCGLSWLV
jgi:hypothetical protein